MSKEYFNKFGNPYEKKFINTLILWDVPAELEVGAIPNKIYCHPIFKERMENVLREIKDLNLGGLIKTYDGCYNPRAIRGYEMLLRKAISSNNAELIIKYTSTHAWALAIDLNAFENGLNKTPKIDKRIVNIFKKHGFRWGGDFKRLDGMHFEVIL